MVGGRAAGLGLGGQDRNGVSEGADGERHL